MRYDMYHFPQVSILILKPTRELWFRDVLLQMEHALDVDLQYEYIYTHREESDTAYALNPSPLTTTYISRFRCTKVVS